MLQKLIDRVMKILIAPTKEWGVIRDEPWSVAELFTKYAIFLAAVPAVAGFIGYAVIGVSFLGHSFRYPLGSAILWMVLQYAFSLGGVFAIALIMDALAPTFGAQKNLEASLKVVVFSYTAAWVGGVFMLLPSLGILAMLAGIYTLVLLYFGMKEVKVPPADKLIGYYVVTLLCAIVVYVVIGFLVSSIALGGAMGAAITSATSGVPLR